MNEDRKENARNGIRTKLLKHVSPRKVAAVIVKDAQEQHGDDWKYHALLRFRNATGLEIHDSITILSEMSDK